MAKNGKKPTEKEELDRIRSQGMYFFPPGAIMHEMHIAADAGSTRRAVIDGMILVDGGVPHCYMAGRYWIRQTDWDEWLGRHAKPHKKGKPRGPEASLTGKAAK